MPRRNRNAKRRRQHDQKCNCHRCRNERLERAQDSAHRQREAA